MKLTELREVYINYLSKTPYENSDYRGKKLKDKKEKHPLFSKQVSFLPLNKNAKFKSYLVFNTATSVERALYAAYTLGNVDTRDKVAGNLRSAIFDMFHNTHMKWPPDDEYLNTTNIVPDELDSFLRTVICGSSSTTSERVQ